MNYYVFTFSGEGLPIAKKLQDEGQNVTVAMIEDNKDILTKDEKHNPEEKHEKERRMALYDGIVPKVSAKEAVSKIKAMSPEKQKETFLFFDFNHCFKYSEELMGTECQGNFPTSKDREMEVSRDEAKAFVEKNYPSLKVAENQEFKSAKDGIKFLSESQDAWVLKGMDEDAKTVVPDTNDPEQANPQVMQALETSGKSYEKSGYILEKMIPNLIEVTPEIHFYNGKPLATTMDIELKRFGGGNTSVMTGCSADLVFETEMESEINKMAFPPVVYEMAKKHKGWFVWDASILFDKDTGEAFFGEYCPNRVGYNCFYSEMTLVGSAKDFFERLVLKRTRFQKSKRILLGPFAFLTSTKILNEWWPRMRLSR